MHVVLRWNSINFEVAKTILASDYAWQLDFWPKSPFYILGVKYSYEYLTNKEIYIYQIMGLPLSLLAIYLYQLMGLPLALLAIYLYF